jgi:thiol-disulfide isomerase/thioredoxin
MADLIRFLMLGLFVASAAAQDLSVPAEKIKDDEAQVVEICNEMNEAFREFYSAADAIKDANEQEKYYCERDPSSVFVQKLVDFEKSHRRTHAGLMAARRLVLLGASGGLLNNPRDVGRREALRVLPAYANNEILPEILRYLNSGNPDVTSEACLRDIITETSLEQNRLFAQYMLARWILDMRDGRTFCEHRLSDLSGGSKLSYPKEKDYLVDSLAAGIPKDRIPELEREAESLLSLVASSNANIRQPAVIGADKNWHIIKVDEKKMETMPPIREIASGLLLHEQHLRVGKRAPELNVKLVNNSHWSISGNQGKTLIIQFSFKGCGPCEAMYPDLRALAEQYADKLSILSITADQNLADTTEAVETGKITWNVAWDGFRGPIATRWAVQAFPTVYVIGPNGTVAGVDLRGDGLREKIAQLAK